MYLVLLDAPYAGSMCTHGQRPRLVAAGNLRQDSKSSMAVLESTRHPTKRSVTSCRDPRWRPHILLIAKVPRYLGLASRPRFERILHRLNCIAHTTTMPCKLARILLGNLGRAVLDAEGRQIYWIFWHIYSMAHKFEACLGASDVREVNQLLVCQGKSWVLHVRIPRFVANVLHHASLTASRA